MSKAKTDPNAPATAFAELVEDHHNPGTFLTAYHPGLTKREWFAGMAMQGLCANPAYESVGQDRIASWACMQADAQIAALNEEEAS